MSCMERTLEPISKENKLRRRKALQRIALGMVGLLVVGWLLNTPPGLLGKADAVGYAVCHQIDFRSFHLGDRPVSLCARCTGIYLGAMLALAYLFAVRKRRGGAPPRRVIAGLGALVVFFGIDGTNSLAHLFPFLPSVYEPNNTLRMLTGTGMGLGMGTMTHMVFNQTIWRGWDARPSIGNLRQLAAMLALGLAGALLALTENPLILYPFTLISAAGVLVLLTLIYASLWLIVLRRENRVAHPRQLFMPLLGGFALAMVQIAGLDIVRYWLTGTWEGFHVLLG